MGLEKIDTDPWIVELDAEQKAIYALIRKEEEQFIKDCEKRGCTILQDESRQCLILVPPSVKNISFGGTSRYGIWAETLKVAAMEQEKNPTIGDRSAMPPRWFNNGQWQDERPTLLAKRVTSRKNRAARGAVITAQEAYDYLSRRRERLGLAVTNSQRAGQRARATEQQERVDQMDRDLDIVEAAIRRADREGLIISAQILSGTAWHLHAVYTDGTAVTFGVPTVGLIAITEDAEIRAAHERRRASVGEVIELDVMRLVLRPKI